MDHQTSAKERGTLLSRRTFLLGGATAGLTILPRRVLGGPGHVAPSDRITLGCIGVGAQGTRVLMDRRRFLLAGTVAFADGAAPSDQVVLGVIGSGGRGTFVMGVFQKEAAVRVGAICDVYEPNARAAQEWAGSDCRSYRDFRELLENEKGLDGVVVCTPDHWHATVSIFAMRKGKHVYCQKPMTHSIDEARKMAEVARDSKVATQVAIANEASDATRILTEWIAAGVIGGVREIHNWSSRPFWPQGIERPPQADPVPEGFDWDLWLGPAPERPFNHAYLPFVWRGWFDFGTGAIGDMGCYSFDTLYRVLKLGAPESVEASSTQGHPETYPLASIIHYEFPARGGMPPLKLHWYDGGVRPPRPDELEESREMRGEEGEGLILVGDGGKIYCGFEGQNPRLIPEPKMKAFQPPPDTLTKSVGHYLEWIAAIKGGEPARANFEFEAPITEAVLLGDVAVRSGKKLHWDSAKMRVTNDSAANDLVSLPKRSAWKI